MRALVSLPVALCLALSPALVAAGDGFLGIYIDADATTPCTAIPVGTAQTLFLIAVVDGATSPGISGAEFRIEVSNSSGYLISYAAPSWSTALGNPIDADPSDPTNPAGVVLGFPCRPPVNGRVPLGTISMFNLSGGPTTLSVKRRVPPSNVNYNCPLFTSCTDTFDKHCMSTSSSGVCTLQKNTYSPASDPAVFAAQVNVDPYVTASPGELIKRLRRQYKQRINFIQATVDTSVSVELSGPVDTILDDIISSTSQYSRATITGRTVVYADAAKYAQIVQLPDGILSDIPRSDAFVDYVRWLNDHVSGFHNLLPPMQIWAGPVAELKAQEERITLSRQGTVLDHIIQLLGTDSTLVFTIDPAPSGLPQLRYHRMSSLGAPTQFKADGYSLQPTVQLPCPCVPTGVVYEDRRNPTSAQWGCYGQNICEYAQVYTLTRVTHQTMCDCSGGRWAESVIGVDCTDREAIVQQDYRNLLISAGGFLPPNEIDVYGVCSDAAALPLGPCNVTIQQDHTICGDVVEVATVQFDLYRTASACGGVPSTFNRYTQSLPPPAFRSTQLLPTDAIMMEVGDVVGIPYRLNHATEGSALVQWSAAGSGSFLRFNPGVGSRTISGCTIEQPPDLQLECLQVGVGSATYQTTTPQASSFSIAVECVESVGMGDGNSLAFVDGFTAIPEGTGVRLLWRATLEDSTASYSLRRGPTPGGPFLSVGDPIPSIGTANGDAHYQVVDVEGSDGDYYALSENRTGGAQVSCAPVARSGDTPAPMPPVNLMVLEGQNEGYIDIAAPGPPPDALIICPEAWVDSIMPLFHHWVGFRHRAAQLIPVPIGTTKEAIRSLIIGQPSVQYVLLVGDDNNPDAPAHTLPTWFVYDSQIDWVLASDAPYGDRNGDWVADVAIGRWPAHTSTEAAVCAAKSIDYDLQSPDQFWRRQWTGFTYDITENTVSGSTARIFADSLAGWYAPTGEVTSTQHRASEIPCCYTNRRTRILTSVNHGSHVVWTIGTSSSSDDFSRFLLGAQDLSGECSMSENGSSTRYDELDLSVLEANRACGFWFGLSCGIGGFQGNDRFDCERHVYIRPLSEKLLMVPRRAALTWFGPTSPSYLTENFLIGREIFKQLTSSTFTELSGRSPDSRGLSAEEWRGCSAVASDGRNWVVETQLLPGGDGHEHPGEAYQGAAWDASAGRGASEHQSSLPSSGDQPQPLLRDQGSL